MCRQKLYNFINYRVILLVISFAWLLIISNCITFALNLLCSVVECELNWQWTLIKSFGRIQWSTDLWEEVMGVITLPLHLKSKKKRSAVIYFFILCLKVLTQLYTMMYSFTTIIRPKYNLWKNFYTHKCVIRTRIVW
jgi:hypothetical protein